VLLYGKAGGAWVGSDNPNLTVNGLPEILVKTTGGTVTIRPVAGTRRKWMKGNELRKRGAGGDLGGTMRPAAEVSSTSSLSVQICTSTMLSPLPTAWPATRSGRSDEVLLARYRLVSVSITRILSPLKIYDLALIRLLDYIEGVGQPLAYYAGELRPPTP
jgi:hypothetical protein